jgi:hypothetical protein
VAEERGEEAEEDGPAGSCAGETESRLPPHQSRCWDVWAGADLRRKASASCREAGTGSTEPTTMTTRSQGWTGWLCAGSCPLWRVVSEAKARAQSKAKKRGTWCLVSTVSSKRCLELSTCIGLFHQDEAQSTRQSLSPIALLSSSFGPRKYIVEWGAASFAIAKRGMPEIRVECPCPSLVGHGQGVYRRSTPSMVLNVRVTLEQKHIPITGGGPRVGRHSTMRHT